MDSLIWQHVKSGGLYRIVSQGLIESDLTPATIYESLWDGQIWIRPTSEFEDGRFINLSIDEVADTSAGDRIENVPKRNNNS